MFTEVPNELMFDPIIYKRIMNPENGVHDENFEEQLKNSGNYENFEGGVLYPKKDVYASRGYELEGRPMDITTTYGPMFDSETDKVNLVMSRYYKLGSLGFRFRRKKFIYFFPFDSPMRSFIFRYGPDVKEICNFSEAQWKRIQEGAKYRGEPHLFDRKKIKIKFCSAAGEGFIPAASKDEYRFGLNRLTTLEGDKINFYSSTFNSECACDHNFYARRKFELYLKFFNCKHLQTALFLLHDPKATTQELDIDIELPKWVKQANIKKIFLPLKLLEMPYLDKDETKPNPVFWEITRPMIIRRYMMPVFSKKRTGMKKVWDLLGQLWAIGYFIMHYWDIIAEPTLVFQMHRGMIPEEDYDQKDKTKFKDEIIVEIVKDNEKADYLDTYLKGRFTQECERRGLMRKKNDGTIQYLDGLVHASSPIAKIPATLDGEDTTFEASLLHWRQNWYKNQAELARKYSLFKWDDYYSTRFYNTTPY